MKALSILAYLAVVVLTGCVNGGDDDGSDDVSDSSDGGDDSDTGEDDGDTADDGDDVGNPDDGDEDDGGADVEPRTGVWDYSEYSPVVNDCDIPSEYGNGGGGFGLVNEGGGTFTVFPNDDTDPFDCALDGTDFECPDRATEEAEVDEDLDATLIGQATAEGTFADPENGSGSQTAVVECEGADCALLEAATGADFPCTFSVDFVIDWRSDP